jgi:4-oxalomesaconate tautomerase
VAIGGDDGVVRLEHPTGTLDAAVDVTEGPGGEPIVERAGIIRTARKLMDGVVFPRPAEVGQVGQVGQV